MTPRPWLQGRQSPLSIQAENEEENQSHSGNIFWGIEAASLLWRLLTSATLLKLHVQRFSVTDDFDLSDTGQPKRPERVGHPYHLAVG